MRTHLLALLICFAASSFSVAAQDMKDGNNIVKCMHKHIDSAQVQNIIATYAMKADWMPSSYAGSGLSFYAPGGYINRVTFYNKDKDLGTFKNTLPLGLNFKMTLKELKEKFPDGTESGDYYNFSSGGYWVEIKFTSASKKKIAFIAFS